MNTLSGTLLFSFALVLASNVYADTATDAVTANTESSATTESTTSESTETKTAAPDDEAAKLLLKKQQEETEAAAKTEAPTEATDADAPKTSDETKMEGHTDKSTEEAKPAEAINYDEEEEPNEDSCD